MKRYRQLIGLGPGHCKEYLKAYADVWRGLLAIIGDADIRNYSRLQHDGPSFAHSGYADR